jgi:hypothetical protein
VAGSARLGRTAVVGRGLLDAALRTPSGRLHPAALRQPVHRPRIRAGEHALRSTTVVTVASPKSVGVAFLLTLLFGPLGMFYSTVSGALIMLGVFLVGGLLFGIITSDPDDLGRADAGSKKSASIGCGPCLDG